MGMTRVAVIGDQLAVESFGPIGALVVPAHGKAQVYAAWQQLPADVGLVILTAPAACALGEQAYAPGSPLTVVMEE